MPPAPTAGMSTTNACNDCGARRACGFHNAGDANVWAPALGRDRGADAPNRVWAVDFQFDATTDGRPVKIVSIVDEHTRECLGGLVERSITADYLIDELDRLAAHRGYPAVLRCDNGPELACAAMADWARDRVGLAFIPPGEPWRNGYVESFNSRVRDECLNINIFWSLAHARVVIADWKYQYNHHRPHSALGYQPPARYAANCTHHTPKAVKTPPTPCDSVNTMACDAV